MEGEFIHELGKEIAVLWIIPFIGLLLSIAFVPLIAPHFWESNKNKGIIATIFGLPVAIFVGIKDIHELEHVVVEYFSFITLLAALFIISGGIYLKGDIRAKPTTNAFFLLVGSVLANFIGTTGASMLLIRAVLRTNRERRNIRHIPVFFIFLVSNIGGSLLPIGDPPLFLGYLEGVPFFWTLKLFPVWTFEVSIVLLIFLVFDTIAYKSEPVYVLAFDKAAVQPLRIEGVINFVWLLGVLLSAIFLHTPLREAVMWIMALLSWVTTSKETRKGNEFTFHPIIEVAVLFAGIFGAMIPCLLILKARGGELGINQPWQFLWATGTLSSFLDNAPTYLTFLSLSQGVTNSLALPQDIMVRGGGVMEMYLKAISVGAVFMGANTYIGNAPNFMVKAISDEWKFKTPSFVGYMLWSMTILIPTFLLVTLVFFNVEIK